MRRDHVSDRRHVWPCLCSYTVSCAYFQVEPYFRPQTDQRTTPHCRSQQNPFNMVCSLFYLLERLYNQRHLTVKTYTQSRGHRKVRNGKLSLHKTRRGLWILMLYGSCSVMVLPCVSKWRRCVHQDFQVLSILLTGNQMEITQHARYTCTFCGKVVHLLWRLRRVAETWCLHPIGLCEAQGCWDLGVPSMQKGARWRCMDCFNNRGCYCPQVRATPISTFRLSSQNIF